MIKMFLVFSWMILMTFLSPSDQGSLLSSHYGIDAFNGFINHLQFVEIPSRGKFTWFGGNSKSNLIE